MIGKFSKNNEVPQNANHHSIRDTKEEDPMFGHGLEFYS